MTLPASLPLSMSQIATELGLALPLSLEHPWVLALAQKAAAPVSMSNLLGKSATVTGSYLGNGTPSDPEIFFSNAPFFDVLLSLVSYSAGTGYLTVQSQSTWWTGNVKVTNNTTATSAVLTPAPGLVGRTWEGPASSNLVRYGYTDNFTIQPSS